MKIGISIKITIISISFVLSLMLMGAMAYIGFKSMETHSTHTQNMLGENEKIIAVSELRFTINTYVRELMLSYRNRDITRDKLLKEYERILKDYDGLSELKFSEKEIIVITESRKLFISANKSIHEKNELLDSDYGNAVKEINYSLDELSDIFRFSKKSYTEVLEEEADLRKLFFAEYSLLLLIAIIVGIIIVILGLSLSFTIRKNIILLKNEMKNIGDNSDLSRKIELTTKDELAEVAYSINGFLEKLHDSLFNIINTSILSKTTGINLFNNIEKVTYDSKNMSAIMQSISKESRELDSEINKINTIVVNIRNIIKDEAKIVKSSLVQIEESTANIDKMVETTKKIKEITARKKEVTEVIRKITEKSKKNTRESMQSITNVTTSFEELMDMIKVIKDFSSQTNLLAMNAAIEAAHASNYGKGFSVVADEIQKLSEQTSLNSNQMSDLLKEIINKMNETYNIIKKTGEANNEIMDSVLKIAESMSEIQYSINEMSNGNDHILQSLQELTGVSRRINDYSSKIESGTQDIEEYTGEVKKLSKINSDKIGEISQGIENIFDAMNTIKSFSKSNLNNVKIIENETGKFKITKDS